MLCVDSLCLNKYKDLVNKTDLNLGLDCRQWLQHSWKLLHEYDCSVFQMNVKQKFKHHH